MPTFHEWTLDLFVTASLACLAAVTVLAGGVPSPIRTALVLPLILVLPGYALVSALFPRGPAGADAGWAGWDVGTVERLALSLGLSLAIVPGVVLVLNFTPYGIRAAPIATVVAALTVGLTVLAFLARVATPADERFGVRPGARFGSALDGLAVHSRSLRHTGPLVPETETQRLLNLGLVAGLFLLAGSVAFVGAVPQSPADDGSFTELYLLQQNESGHFVSEGIPERLASGQREVFVAIGNHEREQMSYTAVVLRQDAERSGGDVRVRGEQVVRQVRADVPANETIRLRVELPSSGDGATRFAVLLYRGGPPKDLSIDEAYRVSTLWVGTD